MSESSEMDGVESSQRMLQKGVHLLEVERYDLAEKELLRAVGLEPEDPDARFLLARALDGLGRKKEAMAELRRAIALQPDWASPHAFLSFMQAREGRNSEAEASVLEALRLDPELGVAYEVYADLMQRTGHLEKAEGLYRKALEIDPESASGHSGLSRVLSEGRRASEASRAGARGLELAPEGVESHASMAYHDIRTGHPFRARAHLREAMRSDPSSELEEALLEADGFCRVVYLPMYYYSLLIERIPGQQFAVWALFLAFLGTSERMGIPPGLRSAIAFGYIGLCLYTWVASPILKVWLRIFPIK